MIVKRLPDMQHEHVQMLHQAGVKYDSTKVLNGSSIQAHMHAIFDVVPASTNVLVIEVILNCKFAFVT